MSPPDAENWTDKHYAALREIPLARAGEVTHQMVCDKCREVVASDSTKVPFKAGTFSICVMDPCSGPEHYRWLRESFDAHKATCPTAEETT